ncbi:VOC family protein [Mycolicibacter senuensis]|uniref:VOC domain-containing protein n=1 Tax=Mycolicibacter senuensis TaxID=386913 RepID=A0A7I9XPU8_9MYCO|nr:VOC family protein [Mycolicibacter senuensis]ORW69483.1 hypothetical protein AWC24_05550 [Mycolicibacter senuensis]GFG72001.1 hypothetical protein MSEN_37210 [Mycolicibacter senuensis]
MFHHTAIAVKDVDRSHKFYTEVMGFELRKVVKRQAPGGGWTKHIFYSNPGEQGFFAIWDLRGLQGTGVMDEGWSGGLSTGVGLPYWVNHIAFECHDAGKLDQHKQRWLDRGYHVLEVRHEFIHSIYTRDPDGTLVEFTYDTVPLTADDTAEAIELMADDTPASVPEYEGIVHKSEHARARKDAERLIDAGVAP